VVEVLSPDDETWEKFAFIVDAESVLSGGGTVA